MNVLEDRIAFIDARLVSATYERFPDSRPVQIGGLVKVMPSQKEARPVLVRTQLDNAPVVVESATFGVQLFHAPGGLVVTDYQEFGTLSEPISDMRVTLLVTCSKNNQLPLFYMGVLTRTPHIRIESVQTDTYQVLTQAFRYPPMSPMVSDPELSAFAITYRIRGVNAADYLTNL